MLIQLIGFVGILCIITTFQFNKRTTILRIQLVSALVWTLHYGLLGAYTGAGLNFWSAIRNFLFERYHKKTWIFWLLLFSVIVICLLTWKDWTSILPTIGCVFATIAMWQDNPTRIRQICLVMAPFWFAYNLLNGSLPGMIGDTINFSSIMVGIIRFDILPKLRSMPILQEAEAVYEAVE